MGEMLLNGRLYGASGIRELTQAQYDALPASKLTDGILYCIKDTGIVEGDKYAPVIYSLEEREIGVHTNGKPLYEKTYRWTISDLHNSNIQSGNMYGEFWLDHVAYDEFWMYDTKVVNKGTNWVVKSLPLNYPAESSITRSNLQVQSRNDGYPFIFFKTLDSGAYNDRNSLTFYYTIRYTKTTDIPGSGTWGTDGVPMVHYDGTEKIIGTWFGETLYEKTIDCGYLLNNAMKDVSVDISNLGIIYKISGIMVTDRVSANVPYLGTWNTGTPDDEVGCYYASGILRIKTRTDRTAYRCYITLQYTKTS